eukprot:3449241-Lingulodinium_polyedra.AAC.1
MPSGSFGSRSGRRARTHEYTSTPAVRRPVGVSLFSGPTDRPEGVRAIFERAGWVRWGVDV